MKRKWNFNRKCYEQERGLFYVAVPEEITDDAGHIYDYLLTDIKDMEKNSIIADLNRVYFENSSF